MLNFLFDFVGRTAVFEPFICVLYALSFVCLLFMVDWKMSMVQEQQPKESKRETARRKMMFILF